MLQVLAAAAVGDQDAVGRRYHHQVLRSDTYHRNAKLVDHVRALRAFRHHVAVGPLLQFVGQGVPCAEVFPFAGIRHCRHGVGVLNHGIVEADLGQFAVVAAQFSEVCSGADVLGDCGEVSESEGEHAAVPQRAFAQQRLGAGYIRFLGEPLHGHDAVALGGAVGYDVAVLGRGIGGLHAHQHHVGVAALGGLGHLSDDLEICWIHV